MPTIPHTWYRIRHLILGMGASLLIIAGLWYFFVGVRFVRVVGSSMSPTLNDGDIIMVDTIGTRFFKLKEGDVVIFLDNNNNYVTKRIYLSIDAFNQQLIQKNHPSYPQIRLAPNSVLMLGDNLANSYDSRSYGSVARYQVVGRVLLPKPKEAL